MHIDSYRFGRIVIDRVEYDSDCLILGDAVRANWLRKQGHLLNVEDLQAVVDAKPAVLVVGCGAYGMMKMAEGTRRLLEQSGIQLEALATHEAVTRLNELSKEGVNAAAALHLTC